MIFHYLVPVLVAAAVACAFCACLVHARPTMLAAGFSQADAYGRLSAPVRRLLVIAGALLLLAILCLFIT